MASLALLFLVSYSFPLIPLTSENLRMVDAFDVDESLYLKNMIEAIENNSMIIHLHWYGHFYYNTGLVLLHLLDVFMAVGEQEITIGFRLLSSIFHLLSCVTLYLFCKRYFSQMTGAIAAVLLLLASPSLSFYSVNIHPDTTQLFFIIASIFSLSLLAESPSLKKAIVTAVVLGCCFGTKYMGMFMLPLFSVIIITRLNTPIFKFSHSIKLLIILMICGLSAWLFYPPLVLAFLEEKHNFSPQSVRYFYVLQAGVIAILLINIVAFVLYKNWKNVHDKSLVLLLGALVFVGVFAFTNPCGFYHLNFLKLFLRHADGINNGVAFNDGSSFVAWLGIITKNISAAPLLIGLLAVPVRLYVKKNNTTRVIMYSWLLVYSCFLLFGVKLRFAHYALPLAPFIFIAFGELIEAIADRLSKGKMVFITAIMIGITAYFGLQLLAFKQTRIAARQNAVQLEVAKWLEEKHPSIRCLSFRSLYLYSGSFAIHQTLGNHHG